MAEDGFGERLGNPEDEIRALEQKLEAKKKELAERGVELPREKEMFREVLREHVEEIKPYAPPPASQQTDGGVPPAKTADDKKKDEERQERVRGLVELALTSTIANAVKKAGDETPYLLDELHDHLVDDYYEKLIALRKIEPD